MPTSQEHLEIAEEKLVCQLVIIKTVHFGNFLNILSYKVSKSEVLVAAPEPD